MAATLAQPLAVATGARGRSTAAPRTAAAPRSPQLWQPTRRCGCSIDRSAVWACRLCRCSPPPLAAAAVGNLRPERELALCNPRTLAPPILCRASLRVRAEASSAAAPAAAVAPAVDLLKRAASDASVPPKQVFAALRTLEQAKAAPSEDWDAIIGGEPGERKGFIGGGCTWRWRRGRTTAANPRLAPAPSPPCRHLAARQPLAPGLHERHEAGAGCAEERGHGRRRLLLPADR